MKDLEHRSQSLGTKSVSHRPIFLIFLFLFFFFFLLVCTSPKHLYQLKQPNFAGMAGMRPVRLIFFPVRNKGYTCTSALVGMVYTGHTGQYGTELTSLFQSDQRLIVISSINYLNSSFCSLK